MYCPQCKPVKFLDIPDERPHNKYKVPQCSVCNGIMKPHCMLFDEQYDNDLYRTDEVRTFIEGKCEGLIVIGTALETGFAKSIVQEAIHKLIPIVEINLESCITKGNLARLLLPSE